MTKKKPFKNLQNFAVASAGYGVTTGVVAGIGSKYPTVGAPISKGLATGASFFPAIGAAYGGMAALDAAEGLKRKKKKR